MAGTAFRDVGGCLVLLRALLVAFHASRGLIMRGIFRGRRSIWRRWRMPCAASRIVNSVSCFERIDHERYFSWQAQHFVTLEDDLCCFAHCK